MAEIQGLSDWLDERQERFIAIANDIWARPEVALAETYACARQADDLAADGFYDHPQRRRVADRLHRPSGAPARR